MVSTFNKILFYRAQMSNWSSVRAECKKKTIDKYYSEKRFFVNP